MERSCDICKQPALYDGKTIHGPWAYMCQSCFEAIGKGTPTILANIE